MARVSFEDSEKYAKGSNAGFFQLKNDKDTATIRFMANDLDDLAPYVVHEVDVDGTNRMVNCIREYDEPIQNCPLCAAGYKQQLRLLLPVYDEQADAIKIWQRGRSFISKLSGLANRYKPLISVPIEVERHGKAGDTTTTYELYPGEKDKTTFEDLPEVPELIGTLIIDASADEMNTFLETGKFDNSGKAQTQKQEQQETQYQRRTPNNRSGRQAF